MKIRATITFEYEADPAHYSTSDPTEMVKEDIEAEPAFLLDYDWTVRAEEVTS